ncbi:hypothetical protein [Escherichia coli]|uniref:hypothetical protein n=1 Tax=Escherichia coli TaxID=562 RepID=UPI001ABC6EC5|nr:hypothetical protein [Escherichia coli]
MNITGRDNPQPIPKGRDRGHFALLQLDVQRVVRAQVQRDEARLLVNGHHAVTVSHYFLVERADLAFRGDVLITGSRAVYQFERVTVSAVNPLMTPPAWLNQPLNVNVNVKVQDGQVRDLVRSEVETNNQQAFNMLMQGGPN